jgi:hypothetical protein
LVTFFAIVSGGCGGGSGGGGSSDTVMEESLKAQKFTSAEDVTAKAKDSSGNTVDVTISDLEVTFDNVTTATASVQAASRMAKVTVSYKMTVGNNTLRYHKTDNVEVSETSSGVYAFKFDGLSLTVDPTSNKITCSGTFKPASGNAGSSSSTEYTISDPVSIPVTKESVTPEPEIPANSVAEDLSAARAETILDLDLATLLRENAISFDADSVSVRGLPDFLDFYGIPQYHVTTSASKGVNVPSMVWLNRLYTETEGGNILLVPLTEGQEYTFEFSKNLTEDLGGVLPHISFYDPSNSIHYLDEAEELDNVTVAVYPKENPSIICYTIKPEKSGNYIVKITNGDSYAGLYVDDNGSIKEGTKSDTGCLLFIYKERRNEAGEPGYYTNFKFKVGDKTTQSISVNDIIELRKMFLELYPDYFKKVYGQNLPDDSLGMGYDFDWADYDKTYFDKRGYSAKRKGELIPLLEKGYFEDYAYFMEDVLANIDVVTEYADPLNEAFDTYGWDNLSDEQFNAMINGMTDEQIDALIKDEITGRSLSSSSSNIVRGAVSTSAEGDDWSSIPVDITGIPYEPRYYMGRGAMAFTMLDPPGAVTIRLPDVTPTTNAQKRLVSFDAATSDDLMKEAGQLPSASDTDAAHPITTDFYAKFVNTASQTEQLTKTTASVSLATSAFGVSAGTGSTNNFKFGLTSTTLVIHYEETEVDYRELPEATRYKAWEKAELFEAIAEDYPDDKTNENGEKFIREFRNDYGDYYVSGYQYGACYDAYVSITTQTSEQLSEVESKLGASLTLDSVQASGDISNTTKDTLKENKATIDVRIVTSGFGNDAPTVYPPTPGLKSGDVNAIDDVFKSLSEFRDKIGNRENRASYAPVRVKMTRWKADPKVSRGMRKKGYRSGNIPLTVTQSEKISAFNTQLKALRGYRNVVADNSAIDGKYKDPLDIRFNTVITRVSSFGDRFYLDSNKTSFDETVKEVQDLTKGFKSLADRFTFYTKLLIAQQQEKETYDRLKKGAYGAEEASDTFYSFVRQMPFGEDHGGASGYAEFAVSEYVTQDINAGKEIKKSVSKHRSKASAERLEWSSTINEVDKSGTYATLEAEATDGKKDDVIFCKVWVRSTNADSKDDRARELFYSPAVGKKNVNFRFRSGYSSSIDWEIIGKSMRMTKEDYPFSGLVTQ